MARRVLPIVVLVPVFLVWLRLVVCKVSYVDAELISAILALASLIVLVLVIWVTDRALEESDAQRRRALEEVERGRLFLDSVIEHLPHMVFVKDAQTLRFVRFNRAGEDLLGYSRDELAGKSDYDFFPAEEAEFFTGKDRAVLQGRVPLLVPEEAIQTRHRGARFLRTTKVPILDEHGRPRYLLGISEDITDTKATPPRCWSSSSS